MVLNRYALFTSMFKKLITSTLLFSLLFSLTSGCSHLGSKSNTNISPTKPIIAVVDNNTEPSYQPKAKTLPATATKKPAPQKEAEALSIVEPIRSNTQLAPTDVLGSIIDSAKKAISLQQWLRAQRHLEHALRVAPKDAEIYYIYADVYEGLGVKAQVVNMLKRAKFLSKPNSDIYQLSSEKLQRLDTHNNN